MEVMHLGDKKKKKKMLDVFVDENIGLVPTIGFYAVIFNHWQSVCSHSPLL